MENRQKDVSELQTFIEEVDTELTMILQHLQWDKKHLLERKTMVGCKHNENHRVPENTIEAHEQQCLLTSHGYSKDDVMLPDPLDANSNTLVKFRKTDIEQIINKATTCRIKRDNFVGDRQAGVFSTQDTESAALEPLTLGRLQVQYKPDERRAIHDAVVSAVPFCHDLSDLALPSEGGGASTSTQKSRTEILSELRDMKRRRTKYRVAAKSRNYSLVLRDVIKTQMEMYSEVKTEDKPNNSNSVSKKYEDLSKVDDKYNSSKYYSQFPSTSYNYGNSLNTYGKHKSGKFWDRSYDNNDSDYKKRQTEELVKYSELKERKIIGERYYGEQKSPNNKRSHHQDYERSSDLERKHSDDRRSSYKRSRSRTSDYKHNPDSEHKDYDEKKYSDRKRNKYGSPSNKRKLDDVVDSSDHSKRKYKEKREELRSRDRHVETRHDKEKTKEKSRKHKNDKNSMKDDFKEMKYERSRKKMEREQKAHRRASKHVKREKEDYDEFVL